MRLYHVLIKSIFYLLFLIFIDVSYAGIVDDYYIKRAEEGDATSQFELGKMYLKGDGVIQNENEAVKWIEKAAIQGEPRAELYMGYAYYLGRYFPQSYEKAYDWFIKSESHGNTDAKYALGVMYLKGEKVSKNLDYAFKLILEAAENDNMHAQHDVGIAYLDGIGITKNYDKAFYWFNKSAQQGYASAQNYMGILYQSGRGVITDELKAFNWYKKAAENGFSLAQNNLGSMYFNGKGVPVNDIEAEKWFRKAAEQGEVNAIQNLKIMSLNGRLKSSIIGSVSADSIYNNIKSTVVKINVLDDKSNSISIGSGIIIREGGIITNCHVLENGTKYIAEIGDKRLIGTILYRDTDRDLCEIDINEANLNPAIIGNTTNLKVGQKVYALGTPSGLDLTFSEGIISALRDYENNHLIQTTAPISPGSSGGGLFNESGELIGITTFQFKGQNLNFALPVEWIQDIHLRVKSETVSIGSTQQSTSIIDSDEPTPQKRVFFDEEPNAKKLKGKEKEKYNKLKIFRNINTAKNIEDWHWEMNDIASNDTKYPLVSIMSGYKFLDKYKQKNVTKIKWAWKFYVYNLSENNLLVKVLFVLKDEDGFEIASSYSQENISGKSYGYIAVKEKDGIEYKIAKNVKIQSWEILYEGIPNVNEEYDETKRGDMVSRYRGYLLEDMRKKGADQLYKYYPKGTKLSLQYIKWDNIKLLSYYKNGTWVDKRIIQELFLHEKKLNMSFYDSTDNDYITYWDSYLYNE